MLLRVFFLLVLMSCNVSYAGLFGDDKAREQINALRNQINEMESRIAKMEQALNSQALLELYAQVETLGLELGRLNGQIEMLSNDNSLLQKRQRDFYIDLDNRLRQIEQPDKLAPSSQTEPKNSPHSMAPSPPPPKEPAAVPPSAAIAPEESTSTAEIVSSVQPDAGPVSANELTPAGPVENSAYKEAYDLFKNGEYAGAIALFESFLENYPQSNLAPGAAYWIGNARYALRDYQLAIDAQRRLIGKYPDSSKVPDAFLNIASSQYEMGDSKVSRHTLENLLAKYPHSEAAKKAKQRLANIR